MPKIDLFLDKDNSPAKLLASDLDHADLEAHQLLLDGLDNFMGGDAKVLVVTSEYDVTVHARG
jgi:hypothetical protein